MNVTRWAVVAAAIGSAGILRAEEAAPPEEKLEEIAPKLEWGLAPWKGFAPGSWVDIRTTSTGGGKESVSECRWTLIPGADGKEPRIQIRTYELTEGPDGRDVRQLGEESPYSMRPSEARFEDLKEVRREKILRGGVEAESRVITGTLVQRRASSTDGQPDLRRPATMWYLPGVRGGAGGVVRTEVDADDPGGGSTFTWDAALVEEAREVRVGTRTLRCAVWRHVYVTTGEHSTGSGETATSAEVPGGLVNSVTKTITKTGSGRREETTVTEVTGFHAKPEGSD